MPSRLASIPTPSPAAITCGPQSGVDEPFSVISAVAPELQLGFDISTLPRILTVPETGAVHERATHDVAVDGGSSSKLLTKPDVGPPVLHSWSKVAIAVQPDRFVHVELSGLD